MQRETIETDPTPPERPPPRSGAGPPAPYPALRNEVQDLWLHDAIRRVWGGRRVLALTIAAFLLVGTVFLLGTPGEFEGSAVLLPEKQESGLGDLGGGLLRQFGGLLGGLGGSGLLESSEGFPKGLYPEVLRSTPVQLSLLEQSVYVPRLDTSVTLFTYLDDLRPFSLPEAAAHAALYVPARLQRWLSSAEPAPFVHDSAIIYLDERQEEILDELQERLDAHVEAETGLLNVSVLMPDPHVAAQVTESAVEQLTAYVTDYRLKKQRDNLAFVQERHDEAQARFNASLDALARFRDRNQYVARELARTEEQRLQAEYDRAFSVYSALSSQLEQAQIQVQEETPIFQVLQPVRVPLQKSFPSTPLTLLLCVLLGLIAGTTYLLLKPDLLQLRDLLRPPARAG